ncbi:hypothetical protein KBY90_00300 [Cyanobium sp. CH-040]|nr:hypothetical protein [Cyanobium sp. CH-040]
MTVQPAQSQLDSDHRGEHRADRGSDLLSDRLDDAQFSSDGAGVMAEVLGVASLEVHAESFGDPVEAYFECITTCSLDDGECITTCTELLREQV